MFSTVTNFETFETCKVNLIIVNNTEFCQTSKSFITWITMTNVIFNQTPQIDISTSFYYGIKVKYRFKIIVW